MMLLILSKVDLRLETRQPVSGLSTFFLGSLLRVAATSMVDSPLPQDRY
jgi:hypothetical protein